MQSVVELVIAGVAALGTAVTAWFTIVLSRLTSAMATEAKRANDREASAEVALSILLNPHYIRAVELTAKNVGAAVARDVTIAVPAPFVRPRGADRERKDLVVEIATLLPGAEVRIFLDMYQSLPKDLPILARAEFDDSRGRHATSLTQDLGGLAPMIRLQTPAEEAAVKLGKAADALERAVSGVGSLRVDVRTYADRERERPRWEGADDMSEVPLTPPQPEK